jgi:hypothetical protein
MKLQVHALQFLKTKVMNIKNTWKAIESRPDIIGWIGLVALFLLVLINKFGVLTGYLAFQVIGK